MHLGAQVEVAEAEGVSSKELELPALQSYR